MGFGDDEGACKPRAEGGKGRHLEGLRSLLERLDGGGIGATAQGCHRQSALVFWYER